MHCYILHLFDRLYFVQHNVVLFCMWCTKKCARFVQHRVLWCTVVVLCKVGLHVVGVHCGCFVQFCSTTVVCTVQCGTRWCGTQCTMCNVAVRCNVVWHALLLSISERGTVSECDHSPTTFSRLLNAIKTTFSRN